MRKINFLAAGFLAVFFVSAQPAHASLAAAVETTTQGAVEFPLGLVKLVGGAALDCGRSHHFAV